MLKVERSVNQSMMSEIAMISTKHFAGKIKVEEITQKKSIYTIYVIFQRFIAMRNHLSVRQVK